MDDGCLSPSCDDAYELSKAAVAVAVAVTVLLGNRPGRSCASSIVGMMTMTAVGCWLGADCGR